MAPRVWNLELEKTKDERRRTKEVIVIVIVETLNINL